MTTITNASSQTKTYVLYSALVVAFFATATYAHAAVLTQQLDFGMTNADVASLQTFLAADTTIYPQGLVTSYFGLLTKAAVINFQTRNGISPVGRVGPITLSAINNQMTGTGSSLDTIDGAGKVLNYGPAQPILSNFVVSKTSNSATITWNSNMPTASRVMYSTVWPFNYRTAPSVVGAGSPSYSQSVTLNNLQSNTTYFYVAESIDVFGNFSWSTNGVSFKTN
jgi:hypothetical protein